MSASGEKRRNKDGGRNDWQTPQELFDLLDVEFCFTHDTATPADNPLSRSENHLVPFTEEDNAFTKDLYGWTAYCNPPYGRGIGEWVELWKKWRGQGSTVVALVPAAPDTEWWKNAYENASEIRLLSGRVKFINPETGKPDGSNTTGSTVFVFTQTVRPKTCYLWDWRTYL